MGERKGRLQNEMISPRGIRRKDERHGGREEKGGRQGRKTLGKRGRERREGRKE